MSEKKKSNVDVWIEVEQKNKHKSKAVENSSRHFDDNDALSAHTMRAIYGQESGFGDQRRQRGMDGAAGDFHLEKRTAKEHGLTATSKNDQRFDVDESSFVAAKYLKSLDRSFSKETTITSEHKTFPVKDNNERKKFALAAYNAGAKTIAKAQQATANDQKDPSQWDDVKGYLEESGAPKEKVEQITEYVEKVLEYEKEFAEKLPINQKEKELEPKPLEQKTEDGYWVTIDDHPVFIQK